jgi:hypothetical protein
MLTYRLQNCLIRLPKKQAKQVLKLIKEGYISDPAGYYFYIKTGLDSDGLNLYHCTRGTSSLEGGVHQNINKKFNTFNASPALADAVLTDYRLRHNLDVSS